MWLLNIIFLFKLTNVQTVYKSQRLEMTSKKEHVSDTAVSCAYEPPDTVIVWTRPAQFTPDKIPVRTKVGEHWVSHTAKNVLQFIAIGRRKIFFFSKKWLWAYEPHSRPGLWCRRTVCIQWDSVFCCAFYKRILLRGRNNIKWCGVGIWKEVRLGKDYDEHT